MPRGASFVRGVTGLAWRENRGVQARFSYPLVRQLKILAAIGGNLPREKESKITAPTYSQQLLSSLRKSREHNDKRKNNIC